MKLVTLAALLCAMLALTRAAGFADMEFQPGKEEAIQEAFAEMEFQPGKEEAIQEETEMVSLVGQCVHQVLPEAETEPEPETEETNQEGFAEAELETEETNQEEDNGVAKTSTCRRCPRGWTYYYGRCLVYIRYYLTWYNAEKYCKALRGHLASVRSYYELRVLRGVVARSNRYRPRIWLGGYRSGCSWYWIDGTRFYFSRWCINYPTTSTYFVDLNTSGGCMENISSSYRLPSVCSRKAW